MLGKKWEPSYYSDSDLSDIAQLGGIVSGPESELANIQFLQWQYRENPAGKPLMWLARDNRTGELVGSYTVIPTRMKIDGKEILGSLSLNTMTHPMFRLQGIFTTLAELTYKSCSEAGILLTIGFPNANSYRGFINKLSFTDICRREFLVKPLHFGNILNSYIQNARLKRIASQLLNCLIQVQSVVTTASWQPNGDIIVAKITKFDNRFDNLWERIRLQKPNMIVRTVDYLNWRFVKSPFRKYKIFCAIGQGKLAGYMVVINSLHPRLRCHVSNIVDVVVDTAMGETEIWTSLVHKMEHCCNEEGVDLIVMRVLPAMRAKLILRRLGYIKVPNKLSLGPNAIILRCHRPEIIGEGVFMDPSNWYLTDGDNDRP